MVAADGKAETVNSVLFLQLFAQKAIQSGGHRFDGETPEDADEFLQQLLGLLDTEERKRRGEEFKWNDPTMLSKLFGGKQVQTV